MPTVWLQERLKQPQPPWWEVVISTVYMSFFIAPYVIAAVLWLGLLVNWLSAWLALGAIALYGYDGFLYSIGFLVAWLVALLLVAELLRNTGKFTMADVLSFRLQQRPVRIAAAFGTMAVCLF